MLKAHAIQFAWFVTSHEAISAENAFRSIIGFEPISVQKNRVPGPQNPFLEVATGSTSTFDAAVQLQPGRMDITYSVNVDFEGDTSRLLSPETILRTAIDAIEGYGENLPAAIRLAIVVAGFDPADDLNAANSVTLSRINIRIPGDSYTDLSFQINKKMRLDREECELNRLVKFGAGTLQRHFVFSPGVTFPFPSVAGPYGSILMLDVNTVPDGRGIDFVRQIAIFKEIRSEILRLLSDPTLAALVE